jgi:hypothetical protein
MIHSTESRSPAMWSSSRSADCVPMAAEHGSKSSTGSITAQRRVAGSVTTYCTLPVRSSWKPATRGSGPGRGESGMAPFSHSDETPPRLSQAQTMFLAGRGVLSASEEPLAVLAGSRQRPPRQLRQPIPPAGIWLRSAKLDGAWPRSSARMSHPPTRFRRTTS